MKWYAHALVIALLIILTYFTYQEGLGFLPFLSAAIYLAIISFKEFNRIKKRKRIVQK